MLNIISMGSIRTPVFAALAAIALLSVDVGAAAGSVPDGWTVREEGLCRFVLKERNLRVAEELAGTCHETAERIFEQLGVDRAPDGASSSVEVRIAADPWDMGDHSPEGMEPPPWSGAVAFPEEGLIILSLRHRDGGPVEDLDVILEHELSHLAMRRALGDAHVPRWFSEGVAIQQSEGSSLDRAGVMWLAAMGDRLLPLDAIDSYPDTQLDVTLAYAQAADFVGYLLRDSGWHGIRVVLNRLRAGDPFEKAFDTAYGSSVARMEKGWRGGMASDWNWLAVVTGSGALWGAIAVLFILAYFSVKRRRRDRLAEMEEEEEPLQRLIQVVDQLEHRTPPAPGKVKIEVDGEIHTVH